jgi:phospholipid N-methyltransferase
MKSIELNQVEQLLQIIQKKPTQRIVHFTDSAHPLTPMLLNFCQNQENDYYLYCTEEHSYEEMKNTYNNADYMHIVKFVLRRPRYLIQAIEYDYLISTLDFTDTDKTEFLSKCYPIIRTGGNLIVIIPNANYDTRDEWRDILEEQYYVSVNIIDDIFDDCDIIVAKRMHGWGN